MTREELLAMGLTEEQVDKVMADHAKVVQAANAKADKYKTDAQKAADLQKQLDEIEQQNLSELEKEKKAREAAEKQAADLQKQLTQTAVEGIFAKANLTGDEFTGIIGALSALDLETAKTNAESFVSGISKRDEANKTQWQKETFDKTPNPGAGDPNKGGDPGEKSAAAEYAKQYSQQHNPQSTQAPTPAPVPTMTF